jgi:hypothetical protein
VREDNNPGDVAARMIGADEDKGRVRFCSVVSRANLVVFGAPYDREHLRQEIKIAAAESVSKFWTLKPYDF